MTDGAGTDAAAPDDLVLVGTIARPHGLRGEVVVHPETDFADERFVPGATLSRREPADAGRIDGAADRRRPLAQGRPLVRFEGVETIEAAEALRGHGVVDCRRRRGRPLEPGRSTSTSSWAARSRRSDGRTAGRRRCARVDGAPGASVLVVETPQGEVLVPLADEICRVIDPARGGSRSIRRRGCSS